MQNPIHECSKWDMDIRMNDIMSSFVVYSPRRENNANIFGYFITNTIDVMITIKSIVNNYSKKFSGNNFRIFLPVYECAQK